MIDTRLYDIRWFDTTKNGKLITRKYQGKIQQTEDAYFVLYRHKIKCLPKSGCIAHVLVDGSWQMV